MSEPITLGSPLALLLTHLWDAQGRGQRLTREPASPARSEALACGLITIHDGQWCSLTPTGQHAAHELEQHGAEL